ncbi:MAG: peptidylprolyl isomerase [Clostridiales bacterium]|nr:peptidylprolyl isomerase [Clostridiales bacterium]
MKREIKYLFILLLVVISLTSCNNKNNVSDKELVAKYGSNQISTNDLYKKLKEKNGLDTILNEVDKDILNKLYKKNTAEDEYYQKELNTLMVTYQTRYSSTYSTFDEFIAKVLGLKNQTEVEEAIRLNYKKRQATQEYLKNTITDKEINDEYQKEKGEIKASHILIAPENSSDAAKKKAKSFAQELIKRIEKGESFEKLAKEYSKDSKEKGGDLGFVNLDSLTKNFREALNKLKINEMTKEPVETEYGYHIILKTGEKKKASLKELREKIIEKLVKNKIEKDYSVIQAKALIDLRKKNKFKLYDIDLEKQYTAYVNNILN